MGVGKLYQINTKIGLMAEIVFAGTGSYFL